MKSSAEFEGSGATAIPTGVKPVINDALTVAPDVEYLLTDAAPLPGILLVTNRSEPDTAMSYLADGLPGEPGINVALIGAPVAASYSPIAPLLALTTNNRPSETT